MSEYGVFFGPYFPAFGLNTEVYSVNLRIQSKCEKIRTRKNSVFGQFSRSVLLAILENIRFLGKMFSIFLYIQYNELYSNFVFIARNCSLVRFKNDFGIITNLFNGL